MRSLYQIAKDYAVSIGRDSEHDVLRYMKFAISGLKDLHFDVNGYPKEVKLNIESNGTADLPSDYVKWLQVDTIRHGRRYPLNNSKSIAPRTTDDCGDTEPQEVTPVGMIDSTTTYTNRHGEAIGRMYGLSGTFNGDFVINNDLHRIEFDQTPSSDIYLKYLSKPTQVDGQYMVHEFLVDPLMYWIDYCVKRFQKIAISQKQYAHTQYVNAKIKAKKRFNSITKRTAEQVLRRGQKSMKF